MGLDTRSSSRPSIRIDADPGLRRPTAILPRSYAASGSWTLADGKIGGDRSALSPRIILGQEPGSDDGRGSWTRIKEVRSGRSRGPGRFACRVDAAIEPKAVADLAPHLKALPGAASHRDEDWQQMRKLSKQVRERRSTAPIAIAALAVTLAACSADTGLFSKISDPNAKPPALNLLTTDQRRVRAIQASDLIGPDGHCADGATPGSALNFQAGPDASPPGHPATMPAPLPAPAVRGIGLEMTECEVERTAGYTDKVEITNDQRGQRHVVLTYLQGEHAGIYRFDGGRLKSIERAPDAPVEVPTKPARHAKQPTPATAVTPGVASAPQGPPASR